MSNFYKVMLMTIALFSMLVTGAYAQQNKPARKSVALSQEYCFGEIVENEAKQTLKGRVSVALVVLTRAKSGLWGPKNDICALRTPSEFHYLKKKVKQPSAETMATIRHMLADVKKGKPTIEPALQREIAGSQYFHNPSYYPSWSKTFKLKKFVANHYIYHNPDQGMVLVYK